MKRILVVDDEPDIREAIKSVLEESLSANVVTAANGAAALQLLDLVAMDLIVADYRMPGMNGVQFLQQADRKHPGIPHILVTAYDWDLSRELGTRAAAEAILKKPVDPQRLIDEVARRLP